MRVLFAVMSCWLHQATHRAIRDTWAKNPAQPVRFFLGREYGETKADEVIVDAPDDYQHVTEKSREIFRYALREGYDYVLHCGRDTYLNIDRVMNAGLEKFEYAGCKTGGSYTSGFCPIIPDKHGWCEYTSGGAGTWLSRRAMALIVNSPLYHQADDLLYGWILGNEGIALYHHNGFHKSGKLCLGPKDISIHLGRGTDNYATAWMYRAHKGTLDMGVGV